MSSCPPLFSLSAASDTEQDAAVKLDQERAEIVAKYDKPDSSHSLMPRLHGGEIPLQCGGGCCSGRKVQMRDTTIPAALWETKAPGGNDKLTVCGCSLSDTSMSQLGAIRWTSPPRSGKEATVEPWEDTNFHLYKVIDRFGFVQYEHTHTHTNTHSYTSPPVYYYSYKVKEKAPKPRMKRSSTLQRRGRK
ncbi:hypothetical protein INR49_001704 [Caranx melampygus]|nr:hypothetical protein INR49_001704 [Caranx melampygus]